MSVQNYCEVYRSTSNGYWKHKLGDIITALTTENHPDQEKFSMVACTLMMKDQPGYSRWLDTAINKLIDDPTSRLDALPELPDYDEMSCNDLLDKYEGNDENYPRDEILRELKYRYPSIIQSDAIESIADLKEKLCF